MEIIISSRYDSPPLPVQRSHQATEMRHGPEARLRLRRRPWNRLRKATRRRLFFAVTRRSEIRRDSRGGASPLREWRRADRAQPTPAVGAKSRGLALDRAEVDDGVPAANNSRANAARHQHWRL